MGKYTFPRVAQLFSCQALETSSKLFLSPILRAIEQVQNCDHRVPRTVPISLQKIALSEEILSQMVPIPSYILHFQSDCPILTSIQLILLSVNTSLLGAATVSNRFALTTYFPGKAGLCAQIGLLFSISQTLVISHYSRIND
jgi:hypothetical protein